AQEARHVRGDLRGGVRARERAGGGAHARELLRVGEQAGDGVVERRGRELGLRQDDGGTAALERPRVVGLVVGRGGRQWHQHGGRAVLEQLGREHGARAADREGGGGEGVGHLLDVAARVHPFG